MSLAPGLILDYGWSIQPGIFTPDRKQIWSINPEGIVRHNAQTGNIESQFYYREVFQTEPNLPTLPGPTIYSNFNRISGCTNQTVAVVIKGRYLFMVDSQTGKWIHCEGVTSRSLAHSLVRPGSNEIWVTDTGESKVFKIR